jgi:hypothetical protein
MLSVRPREAQPYTRYTHVMQKPGLGVRSPFDTLRAGPLDALGATGAIDSAGPAVPPYPNFRS